MKLVTIDLNKVRAEINKHRTAIEELELILFYVEKHFGDKEEEKEPEQQTIEPPKTLADFEIKFPDERTAHEYLTYQRWKDDIECPHCTNTTYYAFKDGIRFKCKKCKLQFTAKTDTFMEASKLPSIKWIQGMWLLMNNPKMTSVEIAKQLNVTQKTAWGIKKKIKWALKP